MQAIKCEMCNSIDVVKDGEYFVCQSCGTKYTVEEAKKLMVEGTVKIDNSEFVQKYLANARRARQKEDWKETEKYYNLVEQNDPTNIEAIFYSSFAQVKLALLEKDTSEKRRNVFNILIKGISVIDDNYDETNEEHQKILFEIMDDIKGLRNGTIVPTTHLQDYVTKNGYGNIVGRSQVVEDDGLYKTYDMIDDVSWAYLESLVNIIAEYSSESAKKLFLDNAHEFIEKEFPFKDNRIEILEKVAPHIDGYKGPQQAIDEIAKLVKIDAQSTITTVYAEIDELGKKVCPMLMRDEAFIFSVKVMNKLEKMYPDSPALKYKSDKSGCYVATCVYDSYDCPQVWTLRRYRDNILAETWYGRAFIKTYYAISPTLVKWFGNTEWFKKMWQGKLNYMVAKLQANGVESTPYEDKKW